MVLQITQGIFGLYSPFAPPRLVDVFASFLLLSFVHEVLNSQLRVQGSASFFPDPDLFFNGEA